MYVTKQFRNCLPYRILFVFYKFKLNTALKQNYEINSKNNARNTKKIKTIHFLFMKVISISAM